MRLWSIHPSYLDTKRLVALWREGLLAKKVLENNTRGYKNHPQLDRFKATNNPLNYINSYLWYIFYYATEIKGYRFNPDKCYGFTPYHQIPVTYGQLRYELTHLAHKKEYTCFNLAEDSIINVHPLFTIVEGDIEPWERVKTNT